ncbi:MAG: DUF4185 domain-containing protein [Proteobacteria bacterium]|nr:DUF4185 domain-containing protein [Pseudomonadota bacterium]MCP4918718.1 DUF4185 domain-containing protein [Pseudomonadota bacterium]
MSVWTFGDTVLNVEDEDGQTWHHNSVGWTTDLDGSDGVDALQEPVDSVGPPRHLLPPTEDEHAFNLAHQGDDFEEPCGAHWATWPGAPVWVPQLDQAVFFYGLIYAEPGDMNFEGRGSGIAFWDALETVPKRASGDADAEHPDLIWDDSEPGWGLAPTVIDDDLYQFACISDGLSRPCYLARADVSELADHDAWTYWSESEWTASFDEADVAFDGTPILSIFWNDHLDAWLAVYSTPFSSKIVARTAPALEGPWSREVTLFEDESEPYDAVHHAEFDEDGGRVIHVSFSRTTDDAWFSSEHAWVRVELAGP